ncbi:uncharacterized protein LOC142324724 [Lycorma delicatula]|uniref:uncharacterized protein LOC142324724 n=1 Tax=Lycorma delicatula TaxID=130591 RepID=UPI003F515806
MFVYYYITRSCEIIFKMPCYAVAKGKKIGVYDSWEKCKEQIQGFRGARYKKFNTHKEAEDFINEVNDKNVISKSKTIDASSTESNADIDFSIKKVIPDLKFNYFSSVESKYADKAFPITKVSPSNTIMNDLSNRISVLESKLSNFMDHVNSSLISINKRLSILEEKKVISNQILKLENKHEEIGSDSKEKKGVKRKAEVKEEVDVEGIENYDDVLLDDDDDLLNSIKKDGNAETDKTKPKLKDTKLSKCKIIDETDGYYGIGQCIFNSRGFLINPFGAVVVYTDGACSNNGRPDAKAGIGVWFNFNHPLNVSAPVRGRATNNNAEIQAATAAILQASTAGIRHLHIYTDSHFLINCITNWIYKWKKNNWTNATGRPVINKVELVELDNSINAFMDSVIWTYVKGHSGDVGNTAADELARQGALEYKPE